MSVNFLSWLSRAQHKHLVLKKKKEQERAGGYLKENSMYHLHSFLYIHFLIHYSVGRPMHHTVTQMIHWQQGSLPERAPP